MKIKVIEEVNEKNGQTITKVTIVKDLKLNPIITGLLICFASLYLILMIGRVIYKNCCVKDASNDENFESASESLDSEVSSYYDEFETRTSYTECEHHGYSDIGRPKDTMSNSSIDQNHQFSHPLTMPSKRIAHQRNVSKLIFNQGLTDNESQS